jgi:hypothetical protein
MCGRGAVSRPAITAALQPAHRVPTAAASSGFPHPVQARASEVTHDILFSRGFFQQRFLGSTIA